LPWFCLTNHITNPNPLRLFAKTALACTFFLDKKSTKKVKAFAAFPAETCAYVLVFLCTFFLDKKSTKKVKAQPRRLPHVLQGVIGIVTPKYLPGAAPQAGGVSGYFFGPRLYGWLFVFF
jgi:hypothetical protein